ncbi:MAG: hypothetical protein DMD67_01520, partial [Gemmatimonadetes bacterium]
DVRFRQLETGLPARFQTPEEIKKQRKIHDKLIEKGLQLIADSFLDQLGKRCEAAGVRLTRQLLEGINYEEIVNEVNRGAGRLPGLIGFDPDRASGYDGGDKVRSDVKVGENGRLVAEDDDAAARLAGTSGRQYDLLAIGAHGLGRQSYSQLGGVVSRVVRGIEKDVLLVRDDRPFEGGRFLVCVDGSSYSYRAMHAALELAQAFGGSLYVCSAFDVEYHHVVFHNIKDVLSYQASKVFKFEEQEELHNNIIDKGLLKLCQANLKRAEVMAQEFPDVPIKTQILVGKPFQVIMQWVEEIKPSLLLLARHGAHRIEGTELGSQAENLVRLAPCNVLLAGTGGVRPEDIPWIEEDGVAGLPWAPEAEVRILRVPPFAQGIARRAVEEYVLARDSDEQMAGRGDPKAVADPHAAHHGDRDGGGDRPGRGQGTGADEGHQGAGPRCRPGAGFSRGGSEMSGYRACQPPGAHRRGPDRLDGGGLAAAAARAAHRPAPGPQHRGALRPGARDLAGDHARHGREQAGDDRRRRIRRRHHDGDVPGAPRQADTGGGGGSRA